MRKQGKDEIGGEEGNGRGRSISKHSWRIRAITKEIPSWKYAWIP